MLQDLYPHMYHNEMSWKAPSPDDIALIFEPDHTVYCNLSGETLTLPRMRELPDGGEAQDAFSIDETAYYLVSAHPGETDTFRYAPSSSLRAMTDGTSAALFAAAAGESLYRWYDSQKFCGRCGAHMEKSTVERAMVCPHCKNTVYPKICPAVIVAITDGDRIILSRYRVSNNPYRGYALIAGFVEIGETFEDTVRREVMEEVGLKVKNIRYYKSQPWAFSDTEMIGFFAELDGDDTIRLQEDELSEAGWYHRDQVPDETMLNSIGSELKMVFKYGSMEKFYEATGIRPGE